MDNPQINTQILSEIIVALTSAKHVITKLWVLKSLEQFADRIETLKPVYEILLKSDPETYVIYEEMAPESIARVLKELKQKAIKEDEEVRQKFVKLVEETVNEYISPTRISRLFNY